MTSQRVVSIIIKGYFSTLFTSLVYAIWKMGRRGERERGLGGGGGDVGEGVDFDKFKFVSAIIVSSGVSYFSLSMKYTRVGFTPQMAFDVHITIRKGALRPHQCPEKGRSKTHQYPEKGRSKTPPIPRERVL